MDQQLLDAVEMWHEYGDHEKIIETLQALSEEERGYKGTCLLARAMNNLHRWHEAAALLDAVAEAGREDPLWHFRKGYTLYGLNRLEKAEAEFRRVLDFYPDSREAQEYIGACVRESSAAKQLTLDPELYSPEELEAVENHITAHFGPYERVFHELISPDIHVDVAVIEPTEDAPFYTLVTIGMGAHRMHVPDDLTHEKLDRAEVLVCLPADWNIESRDEKDYWPVRWLKMLARLPERDDTWLGWGHTVTNDGPFASNTGLGGVMLVSPCLPLPYAGGDGLEEAAACTLPNGEEVNFYQYIPIYPQEMDFKIALSAEALLDRFGDEVTPVTDIHRRNVCERRRLEFRDFYRNDIGLPETFGTLWERGGVLINVDVGTDDEEESAEALENALDSINEALDWLEEHLSEVEDALIEADMPSLAEDLLENAEEVPEEKEECYLLSDGSKVFPPISDEDFLNSLWPDGISVNACGDEIEMELFLGCSPDYFSGRSISVYISADREILCGGIAD